MHPLQTLSDDSSSSAEDYSCLLLLWL